MAPNNPNNPEFSPKQPDTLEDLLILIIHAAAEGYNEDTSQLSQMVERSKVEALNQAELLSKHKPEDPQFTAIVQQLQKTTDALRDRSLDLAASRVRQEVATSHLNDLIGIITAFAKDKKPLRLGNPQALLTAVLTALEFTETTESPTTLPPQSETPTRLTPEEAAKKLFFCSTAKTYFGSKTLYTPNTRKEAPTFFS